METKQATNDAAIAELVSAIWALKMRFVEECYDEEQRIALRFADAVLAKYPEYSPFEY